MFTKIKELFSQLPRIPVTKRNMLLITADISKGVIIVSYKGKVKYGKFTDKTLHQMMKGPRFEKHASDFLAATGKLINQLR